MALIPLLPQTWALGEPKWLCIFPTLERPTGALSTPPAPSDPWGQRASSPRSLSVFTYLRLPIQIKHSAGTFPLGRRTPVLPLIPSLRQSCMLIQRATDLSPLPPARPL